MPNQQYIRMLESKDVIFEIFARATERKRAVGEENVYDFSLGNPSVPAPDEVKEAVMRITKNTDPVELHSYSPAGGIPSVRKAIADDLNKRFGMSYEARHIFMTCGASAALAHAFRAVCSPGETILTFAPCFSEYETYVTGAGYRFKVVPPDPASFQIPFSLTEELLTEDVAAVLINSPNNPSGVVYTTKTIEKLSEMLLRKEKEFSHPIYLISDEPYREILFSGTDSPYIARYYPNTITCYSFSKSLSLPGERIGYAAVNPAAEGADILSAVFTQISRVTGHNGAPALWQRTAAQTCMRTADLSVYEKNRNLLLRELSSYGYSIVPPGGTFYMFPKAPGGDAAAFCRKAMEKDLLLVPGNGFGCPDHFRIAYCVPTRRIEKSLPVFRELLHTAG